MVIALLIIAFQNLEGDFYPVGPWPHLLPSIDHDGKLVIPQSEGYIHGDKFVKLPGVVDVIVDERVFVQRTRMGRAISNLEVYEKANPIHSFPFECYNLQRVGRYLIGSLVHDAYLVVRIDFATLEYQKMVRRPKKGLRRVWGTVLGEQTLFAWNGLGDRLIVTNYDFERINRVKSFSEAGSYPHIPLDFPRYQAGPLKIVPIEDALNERRREMIAQTSFVHMANIGDGFFIAQSVGVTAPGHDNLFIGSQIEIRFYRKGEQIGPVHITHGQILGVRDGQIIIFHHNELTPSPTERWGSGGRDPEAHANKLAKEMFTTRGMPLKPYYERVRFP